jgi:hypothetical protein
VQVPDCAAVFVTVTSTAPAGWAGVVALIDVALTTTGTPITATPPTLTVEPMTKFVPVITIAVTPLVTPLVGLTAVTVGGAVL